MQTKTTILEVIKATHGPQTLMSESVDLARSCLHKDK